MTPALTKQSAIKKKQWDKKKEHAKTWKRVSIYVRLRDGDMGLREQGMTRCICGAVVPIKNADCGHYIHGGSSPLSLTDFFLENLHAQCKRCNHYDKERGHRSFERYMQENHPDAIPWIEMKKREVNKWTEIDYKEFQESVENLIKQLST
jgi:hypothetical protein